MKHQSGRSLLEMIAVVGIIGILTVAGISGLGGGTVSMRATAAQYDIEEYAKRMIELNAWNRDGSFTDTGVDTNGLSENLRSMSLSGNCSSDNKCDGFSFEYRNLSQRECQLLLSKTFSDVCPNGSCDGASNILTFTYKSGDECSSN